MSADSTGADVSFCMIVRNCESTLPSCLNSVRHLAAEMVVVDTGSTDNTIDVARSMGARVVSEPWRGNFAAARNEYLRHAKCSWILSLDADEILGSIESGAFHELLARDRNCAYIFTIRNYFLLKTWTGPMAPSEYGGEVEPGVGWTPSRTIRLFPRRERIQYRFPVHESLIPDLRASRVRVRHCAVPIHHTGFFVNATERASKRHEYRALGLRKLSENPRYPLAYLELGDLFFKEGDLDKAELMFTQCIRLSPFCAKAHYYSALTALQRGRPEQARDRARRSLKCCPRNLDIQYVLGLAEMDLGDTGHAMATLAPVLRNVPRPWDPLERRAAVAACHDSPPR